MRPQETPDGQIDVEPILQDGIAQLYVEFLRRHDPIETWKEVVPLEEALETKGIDYPMPWEQIQKLANYAPNLPEACESVEWGNEIAPMCGLRYAYTRLIQQAYLLQTLDELIQSNASAPTAIVEVGCFTGGLLHFIAESNRTIQTIGFDLSPVALDIASRFSDHLGTSPRPHWLEADFSLVRPELLPEEIADAMKRPVILVSNVLHAIGKQLSFSPAVDQWHAEAGLISYWVNRGAFVVVSDRSDDPEGMIKALVDNGRWNGDGCRAVLNSVFECWSTRRLRPESPLGDWYWTKSSVMTFYDSTWS